MNEIPSELRALALSIPPTLRLAVETAVFSRYDLSRRMGMSYDGDRDMFRILGYPDTITTEQYRNLYQRGGIAGRAVDALPKAVWRGDGQLVEDQDVTIETKFELEFYGLNDRLKIWSTLQRLHIQASLTSFAVLLLGAEGDFTTELPRGKGPEGILYVQPYGGGVLNETRGQRSSSASTFGADATVATWEESAKSPRFGQPTSYSLRRTDIVSPEFQRPVHWTRVIHVPAEGFLDDSVYGPPALEGVWNYFEDLLKVVGGGSEAAFQNMHPGMHMDIDKDVTFLNEGDATQQIDSMKQQAELYKHQLTRWIQTRGVKVKQLTADATNFGPNGDFLVKMIAGTRGIPLRLLTGSEMGQLASEQDRDNWNDQVKDCRSSYAHPIVLRPFIERLIAYGYMSKPKQWEPRWPEVEAMKMLDRLKAAEIAAKLNDHGEKVITGNEIREEFLDKEPIDPADMDEEDDLVAKLEAALRKGGTLSIAVKG